jgi:hypothetical protein
VKEFRLTCSHDAMNHLPVKKTKWGHLCEQISEFPGADDCMSEYYHAPPVRCGHTPSHPVQLSSASEREPMA